MPPKSSKLTAKKPEPSTVQVRLTSIRNDISQAINEISKFGCSVVHESIPEEVLGPIGLLSALQCIYDKTDNFGGKPYPSFPPRSSGLVTVQFLESCISLGNSRSHYEDWFQSGSGSLQSCATVEWVLLTEWGTSTPLSFDQNISIKLMHVVHAILQTKPEFLREFNALGGFELFKLLVASSSLHFKMQFCDFLNNFHENAYMMKCCVSNRLLHELFNFLAIPNVSPTPDFELSNFSAVVLENVVRNMDGKLLRKFVGAADISGMVTALTGRSLSMKHKWNLSSALNSMLLANEELREEFVKPENMAPIVALLASAVENESDLRAPGRSDPHGHTWWLTATLGIVIGTAAGGSKARQDSMGQHPKLLPTLVTLNRWYPDKYMGEATTSCLYKCCARSPDNYKQLLTKKMEAVSVLLDCFDIDFSKPVSATNNRVLIWSSALGVVGLCVTLPEFRPSEALKQRIFGVFDKMVKLLDSPRSATITFDHLQSVFNYTNVVSLMRLDEPVEQLVWILRCCTCRSTLDYPFLVIMSDHLNRKSKYVLPEPFMEALDAYLNCQMEKLTIQVARLADYKSELSPEFKERYYWVAPRLRLTPLLDAYAASVERNKNTAGSGGEGAGAGGRMRLSAYRDDNYTDKEGPVSLAVCAAPLCSNHESLKKCGRCFDVAYCGSGCQKGHWPSHKLVCIKTTKSSKAATGGTEN